LVAEVRPTVGRKLASASSSGPQPSSAALSTPQGGPASPFLANSLLDDLDQELARRGLPCGRHADDVVNFTRSRRAAEQVFRSVTRDLTPVLRLAVNETQSRIVEADGVAYLGFVFRGRRATIHVSENYVPRFQRPVRELTGRSRGLSREQRMSERRSCPRGWAGYFGLTPQWKLFDRLDQWLRRRLTTADAQAANPR